MKDERTCVVFRKWKDGGVIALFPLESHNDTLCMSFEHVGQHGGADYKGVVRQTVPATPTEYAGLKAELESVPYGYKLRVCRRAP